MSRSSVRRFEDIRPRFQPAQFAAAEADPHDLLQLLALIALFIFFVAGWLAQFLARQISGPISALVRAAEEVSRAICSYRVDVRAIDELAQLVGGFNRMTADLEANRSELDARRRFTEAILESIPTGIISVDPSGAVQRVNKALDAMFPGIQASRTPRVWTICSRAKTPPRSVT